MIAWLLLLSLAVGSDRLLAPTLDDLDASLGRAEQLLARATTASTELSTVQHTWVDLGCAADGCMPEVAARLLVQGRDAGHRSRDLVQGLRAEVDRLDRMAAFPSVTSLIDRARTARLEALRSGTVAAVRGWSVRAAWHVRFLESWAARHPGVALPCVGEDPP